MPSNQADNLARAERLRAAAETVARDRPPGFERDVTDVLRRIGLMCSALTSHDVTTTCRRCSQPFTYNAAHFRPPLSAPRHCFHCREQRRAERARSGVPASATFPPEE
jgi:hypothetical protein